MRRLAWLLPVLFLLAILYLLAWPTTLEPLPYHPPEKPAMVGPLAPNTRLAQAEFVGQGRLSGPEDTVLAPDGTIYCGCDDGTIGRIAASGLVTTLAVTGGRPLGMALDAQGELIVCDGVKGLLRVDLTGRVTVLATEAKGGSFGLANGLDIGRDGSIYFTDASSRYGLGRFHDDLLSHRPYGRFMVYSPTSEKVRVLLDDLYYANGVALSQREDFALIVESCAYRVRRYWLKGPRSGTSDVFADNLPGFADNVSSNGKGTFWLAMFSLRSDLLDRIHPYPVLKSILSRIPRFVLPAPKAYGLVLALDETGSIVQSLHDPTGEHLGAISSVREWKGHLYLGSLRNDCVGRYPLGAQGL